MNYLRKKGKPWCKLSYKVFQEQYGYDQIIDIFLFPILFQLADFIGGIPNCVRVIVKFIFDRNITLALPLTHDNIEYSCTNDDDKKLINDYKLLLKSVRFFQHRK